MCLILSCSSAVIMLFEMRSALNQIMLYMPVIYLIDRHQMILLSLTGAYVFSLYTICLLRYVNQDLFLMNGQLQARLIPAKVMTLQKTMIKAML